MHVNALNRLFGFSLNLEGTIISRAHICYQAVFGCGFPFMVRALKGTSILEFNDLYDHLVERCMLMH